MTRRPVLVIALDGYEPSLADEMAAQGLLPAFKALGEKGARFDLEHGAEAKRTGLAAEHFATALDPDAAARWSAVDFDPRRYEVTQHPTARAPFPASLGARTVVFDAAYFDLNLAPSVRGVVNWGAHDPGVAANARPLSLQQEIAGRFGRYPAGEWIYGFVWPSPERTARMAHDLERAVDLRADIAHWLLKDRLPDWDLGVVMVSECHSAIEALWHGVDPTHPLHGHASAKAAGEGVRGVYLAIDRLIGKLCAAFPDAAIVLFSMHGMGSNDSDVASMALLPELLYRQAFGKPYMRDAPWPPEATAPELAEHVSWHDAMMGLVPDGRSLVRRARDRLAGPGLAPLEWMPAARYRRFWPRMPAFALPSFYDGRIRLNVVGREARGMVPIEGYETALDGLEALLEACVATGSGEPVVRSITRSRHGDPRELAASDADIIVVWRNGPLGLEHPKLGRIGPLPWRRTGGHSGVHGMAIVSDPRAGRGRNGLCSAFDVAPTILDLLNERPGAPMSGASMLARETLAD